MSEDVESTVETLRCRTCGSENIEDCPEDPDGRWRCDDCGARFHGPVRGAA